MIGERRQKKSQSGKAGNGRDVSRRRKRCRATALQTLRAASGTINLQAAGAITIGDSNNDNVTYLQAQGGNNDAAGLEPGSGGTINITSTDNGDSTLNTGSINPGVLASRTITIIDSTTVTVNGAKPLNVFGDNLDYSATSFGNDSTTGKFNGSATPTAVTTKPFAASPVPGF